MKDGVEGAAELRVPVVEQEPRPLTAIIEVHQQVARLLQHLLGVWAARAGQILDPPAADADEDEHVQALAQNGVDAKEVAGEHRCRVLAQKRAPAHLVTLRRWREARAAKNVTHPRPRDVDSELAQLAGDAEIAPATVLARDARDELTHLIADRRVRP